MAPGLLATYRRTGADPPFGDPGPAHGVALEGYYWRLTDAAAGRVVVVLCGVCRSGDGVWASVALAAHPGGFLRTAVVPVARAETGAFGAAAGEVLGGGLVELRARPAPDAEVTVRLSGHRPWPRRRPFGGIGPAQLLPGLPGYWHPHVLGARVEGEARLGGERVALDGAVAYVEKNWGAGFPPDWWWGQAHDFPAGDACVAFAGGRMPLGARSVAPTAVAVRLDDRVLRLAPPLAAVRVAASERAWRVRARSPRLAVELEGDGEAPHVLPVPEPAERRVEWRSLQHLAGRLAVSVRRGPRTLFRGESQLAGLERGMPVSAVRPDSPRPARAPPR